MQKLTIDIQCASPALEKSLSDIASATRAWKYIDHGVSKRIMSVINNNCNSPEEVDALLNAISDNS